MTDYKCRDEAVGEKIAKFLQWNERKHVTSKLEDVNGSDQRDGCSSHTSDTSHLCQNPEICWYEIRLIFVYTCFTYFIVQIYVKRKIIHNFLEENVSSIW